MNDEPSSPTLRALDFAVIGAQKSGSTYMLNSLREHPDIVMPQAEVPFFETGQYSEEAYPQFLARWKDARADQCLGVKRPNWLCLADVPARMARHMPDCKLIAVLRNPIERAVSGYFHYMHSGFIPIEDIETGMPKLLEQFDAANPGRPTDVLNFGLYGAALQRWLAHFPKEQLHVVLFDQLKTDPQTMIRETFSFCGVRSDVMIEPSGERPMASMYSLPRLRLRAMWYQSQFTHVDGVAHLKKPKITMWRKMKFVMRDQLDRWVWSHVFKSKAPKLSPELRQKLIDFYRADVEQTQTLLGCDLSHWLKS